MRKELLFIVVLAMMASLTACRQEARATKEAETHFREGLEQRAAKNTEAAAESFSNALLAINRCDPQRLEVKCLKAQIEDNLGAMYWKHELSEEALALHLEAVALLRELDEPDLLMKALRNCGRVMASMQRTSEAQAYYDEAFQIAENLQDNAFLNELLMETSHDLYLESGDYRQAIEKATKALNGGADPGFCHLIIGLSYYYLMEDSLALTHLREATQSEKPSVRRSAYQGLYQLHQLTGDYPKALGCHELYTENMMQADQEFRSSEVERIKADYDLQMQKNTLQAEQKLKSFYLYLVLGGLLVALAVVLLLLRQKTLSQRLKEEEVKNELETALKKNKVYVTALALAEQITASSLDFNLKESDWDDFIELVNHRHQGFVKRLLEKFPTLTKGDVQICCLTKMGFSNQVISILMNQQAASYARRKSRIKQEKMNGVQDERSFEEIISEI